MSKVVINKQFGGFGLSDEATREYLKRKGHTWREEKHYGSTMFMIDDGTEQGKFFSDDNIERNDPDLVAIVEELGDKANGTSATLVVEEVPTGVQYRIDEYDGLERLEYRDTIDWRTG